MDYTILAICAILITAILIILGSHIRKLNKTYNDIMNEVTNQYFEYDAQLETKDHIIGNLWWIIEWLELEVTRYKTKVRYRNNRINELEAILSKQDKKILRWRKLTK